MNTPPDMSHDWRDIPLPENIAFGSNCFVQSAQSFGMFHSARNPGLVMGDGSGIYSQSQLVVGVNGRVSLGNYACINSATLHCETEITIGAHCLVAWGVVITDTTLSPDTPTSAYRHAMMGGAPHGAPPVLGKARPVALEDNVWIGFGSVVLPGVTIGEGSIVGTRTVIAEDVPPYVVVAGSPPRVVRQLEPPANRRNAA